MAADIEMLVPAHPVKGRRNGPPLLKHLSGHREVFSGLGSVLFLDGRPGDATVTVHHVKLIKTAWRRSRSHTITRQKSPIARWRASCVG